MREVHCTGDIFSPHSLTELCYKAIIQNIHLCENIRGRLPTELKERMFSYLCDNIFRSDPRPPSLSKGPYPKDRYRDVHLVNRITCQRVIPLCFAMWSSLDYQFDKVKRLIEEGVCDVNESDLEGFCPLHYAAIYGRVEACRLLLEYGADCTRRNNFNKTPLDLAQDARVKQMLELHMSLFSSDELECMASHQKMRQRVLASQRRGRLKVEFMQESASISKILDRYRRAHYVEAEGSLSQAGRAVSGPSVLKSAET